VNTTILVISPLARTASRRDVAIGLTCMHRPANVKVCFRNIWHKQHWKNYTNYRRNYESALSPERLYWLTSSCIVVITRKMSETFLPIIIFSSRKNIGNSNFYLKLNKLTQHLNRRKGMINWGKIYTS
jgi:hypothetical protein